MNRQPARLLSVSLSHLPDPVNLHSRAVISLLPLKNPAACPAPPADEESTAQSAVTGDWWAFAKEVTCSKAKTVVGEGGRGVGQVSLILP